MGACDTWGHCIFCKSVGTVTCCKCGLSFGSIIEDDGSEETTDE